MDILHRTETLGLCASLLRRSGAELRSKPLGGAIAVLPAGGERIGNWTAAYRRVHASGTGFLERNLKRPNRDFADRPAALKLMKLPDRVKRKMIFHFGLTAGMILY